jgi:hypothetical protein
VNFLANLCAILIEKLFGRLWRAFSDWRARRKAQEQNLIDAKKSVEPLKKAQTEKEVDDATPGALDGL